MRRVGQQEHRLDRGEVPVDDRHRRLVGDVDLRTDAFDEHPGIHVLGIVDEQAHAPRGDDDVAVDLLLGDGLLEQAQALRTQPEVNLAFAETGSWLSVAGRVEFVEDRQKIDELWDDGVSAWFDGGKEDPNLGLIRFESDSAQFWGQPGGKVSALASIMKARVTGERPSAISATTEM